MKATSVRAAQAIAMLGDPIVLFLDEPADTVRALVLDGVRRLIGPDPVVDAPAVLKPSGHPRRRGRQSLMNGAMTMTAKRLHDGGTPVDEIAAMLGVSRATIYRHLDL